MIAVVSRSMPVCGLCWRENKDELLAYDWLSQLAIQRVGTYTTVSCVRDEMMQIVPSNRLAFAVNLLSPSYERYSKLAASLA